MNTTHHTSNNTVHNNTTPNATVLKQLIMTRYATKKFDGKTIPQHLVDELFEMIRHAPSSFNTQTWRINVITDPAIKAQLAPSAWNQSQITTCSHLLVFCTNTNKEEILRDVESSMKHAGATDDAVQSWHDMVNGSLSSKTPEQLQSWAQRQTFLALANALLGAKALGFDSCPMEGFDPEAFARILNLPSHIVPTALCTIGYAADEPRKKVRIAKEKTFF